MRKQYHFRSSEQGLIAWDVDRLVALTRHFPRSCVPLTAITELDEPYWCGPGNRPLTCREVIEQLSLIDAADLAYPIILSSDGRVMDGMHRVAKALIGGESFIEAVRFESDPQPDYVGVTPEELPY